MVNNAWDAAGDATSSFGSVTRHGDDLVRVLNPQPGERVLGLAAGPVTMRRQSRRGGRRSSGMDLADSMLVKARRTVPG